MPDESLNQAQSIPAWLRAAPLGVSDLASGLVRRGAILGMIAPTLVSSAQAQVGLSAAMTPCAVLQSTVARDGAAVVQTAPYLYDRYVSWCSGHQREEPAYLRTRDTSRCFVGYLCKPNSN